MESRPGVWKDVYGKIAPCFGEVLKRYAAGGGGGGVSGGVIDVNEAVPADPEVVKQMGEECLLQEKGAHYPTTTAHLYSAATATANL